MAKVDFKENGSKGVEISKNGAQDDEVRVDKDELSFKAAFTHKEMYKIEENLGGSNLAVSRRLTLSILTARGQK